MKFDDDQLQRIRGSLVIGSDGEKIGKVVSIWTDDDTGIPEWVSVHTGWFDRAESFIPLQVARLTDRGLEVPFSREQVRGAARIGADIDHLSAAAEDELYRHYGVQGFGGGVYQPSQTDEVLGTYGDVVERELLGRTGNPRLRRQHYSEEEVGLEELRVPQTDDDAEQLQVDVRREDVEIDLTASHERQDRT